MHEVFCDGMMMGVLEEDGDVGVGSVRRKSIQSRGPSYITP